MYIHGKTLTKSLLVSLVCLSNTFASSTFLPETSELLLAPKCFIDNNSFTYNELVFNAKDNTVLFSVDRESWWKQLESINHKGDCGKFINVNYEWDQYLNSSKINPARVSTLDYGYFLNEYLSASNQSLKTTFNRADVSEDTDKAELLKTLYKNIDVERISNSLDELTSFYNRAAYSDTGYQAAGHIRTWMDLLASKNELTDSQFSVSFLPTNTFYRQPSVVAVLGKDLPGNALVISAHLDTNGGGRRPGADDDGSGSMVVLEAARLIANSGHEFNRPIYFIWYAAEEVGLVGSKRVVQDMKNRGVKVDSVLHFDTVGRRAVEDDPTLWLLKDYVDPNFTDYISGLIKKHIQVPVQYTTCGYACSDHASWTNGGFSSAAAFESSFDDINPYLHTANDTRDHVSLENLVNFTKLALAYAVDKSA